MSEGGFTESFSFESRISPVQDLTFDYLRTKFNEIHISLTEERTESFHIGKDGKYTQPGYMLSDQYDLPIRIAAFADFRMMDVIGRNEFTGCILKQMDDAFAFISKYNRTASVIKGIYREDRKISRKYLRKRQLCMQPYSATTAWMIRC